MPLLRRLTLAPLAVAVAVVLAPRAAPAQAHGDPVVSATLTHAPRTVYVAALDALEEAGFVLHIRSLDQMLLTHPRFTQDPPRGNELAPQLRVDFVARGDSTYVEVNGRAVPARERELDGKEEEQGLAVALAAQVMLFAAMDSALSAAPAPAADPREATDEYGYGRGNPIRTGGGRESGARRQREFLSRLRGPGGERVVYRRLGSCCPFSSPAAKGGSAALDAYEVTHDGLEAPAVLYLDLYTEPDGAVEPPRGFTVAADSAASQS